MARARIEGRLENADLPDAKEVITSALDAAMHEAVLLLERRVKLNTPIGVTESARGSIGSEVRRGVAAGRGVPVVRGFVGSPLAHVLVLDRGRRPGAPPPPSDALELWVRRRMGVTDIAEAQRVAFLVARAIGRRGTKALHIFDRAVRESQSTLDRIFDRAGVAIAVRVEREKGKRGRK
ncbi:MAG: hypothetical protein ACREMA_02250 [Longimicrobiales bacterium]